MVGTVHRAKIKAGSVVKAIEDSYQKEIFDEIVNNVTINKVAINIGKSKLTLIYHIINGNIQDFYKFYKEKNLYNYIVEAKSVGSLFFQSYYL